MPPRPNPFKKNKRPFAKPLPAYTPSASYKSKMAYGAASALASLHPYSRAALIGTRLAYNAYKRYTYKPPPGPRTLNGRQRTTDSGNYGLSGEIAMYKQGTCPPGWIGNARDQHIKLTQSSTYSITAQTGRQGVQQGSAVWNTSDINAMLSAVSTQLLVTAGSAITINLSPEGTSAGDKFFSGDAIVTAYNVSASFDGMVEAEMTFTGTGAVTVGTHN